MVYLNVTFVSVSHLNLLNLLSFRPRASHEFLYRGGWFFLCIVLDKVFQKEFDWTFSCLIVRLVSTLYG